MHFYQLLNSAVMFDAV